MAIPVIDNYAQLIENLRSWRKSMSSVLRVVRTPAIPWNFAASSARGGIQLTWSQVEGADGYQILRSADPDFSSNVITIPITSNLQTSYVDAIAISGTTLPTYYYKIRATAGTINNPHSVLGLVSGIVSNKPIDPSDTTTASTTSGDTTTTDVSQSYTRYSDGSGDAFNIQ